MNTSKTLQSLIYALANATVHGPIDQTISTITLDSRAVATGTLFIAQSGETVDGHAFIETAIEHGSTVIVCEKLPEQLAAAVAYVQVPDTHGAAGLIAAWYYDFPAQQLELIGVTGTNGKTTVATLTWEALRLLGKKTGLISTVSYWIDDVETPSTHTTPDALSLQKLFRTMVDEGCTHVAMEVSSHAIAQKRIAGLSFRIGMFTNLTQDHLNFHKTMENYRDTKKQFFTSLPATAAAITNLDDGYGPVMIEDTNAKKVTYSLLQDSNYHAENISLTTQGTTFTIEGNTVKSALIGSFNLSNSLAVYAALRELGFEKDAVAAIFPKLVPPTGRFEVFRGPENRVGIVDYAHTPDGLEKLLTTVQSMKPQGTSVIAVFGCGGNRDVAKRAMMGTVASLNADYTIITSDNPRNESPEGLCNDIASGFANNAPHEIIIDRKEAILRAIALSKPNDTIVVAGKGHEQYQYIADQKIPFSDRKIVSEALTTA